ETLLTRLQGTLLPSHQAQLTTQHRMVAPIGNLINGVFYDNSLKSVRIQTCPVLSHVFRSPVAWFCTRKLGLQFVVITLIADTPTARADAQASGAFSTPSVVHFG